MFIHIWSRGLSRGNGFWAAFSLSKLQALSYANTISWLVGDTLEWWLMSHCKRMINTWDGDSDLKTTNLIITPWSWSYDHVRNSSVNWLKTYLKRGCQVSMCPPPLTMNWWPLDHRRSFLDFPVSLRHNGSELSSTEDRSTISGWSSSNWSVPTEVITQCHTCTCCCYVRCVRLLDDVLCIPSPSHVWSIHIICSNPYTQRNF